MIKEINTPAGVKTMLLGYQTIKDLTKFQKEKLSEFQLMEKMAHSAFNVFETRKNLPLTTMDEMLEWFDEPRAFLEVQAAITEFTENFTEKGSPKA